MFVFDENNLVKTQFECRAILVGVQFGPSPIDESMEELRALAEARDVQVMGELVQARERPESATFIGKGKVQELEELCRNMEADTVIFNHELSGMQIRNLEDATGVAVLDRTILILDIFAQQAASRIGKLQVELAQLQYRLPRLTGFGKSLSRTGGGIGTRGPGEKKLETDRRHIQSRMDEIRREIRDAEKTRSVQRKKRTQAEIPIVSLVGYTNAGKSALMNAFIRLSDGGTGETAGQRTEMSAAADEWKSDTPDGHRQVFEKDMLFATLDVSHRHIYPGTHRSFILVDTVGFVSRLPHSLVEAFKGTLEEVLYSDLLIQVVDLSSEDYAFNIEVTENVLREIGAEKIPRILVYNKVDRIEDPGLLPCLDESALCVSARTGENLDLLEEKIMQTIFSDRTAVNMLIPYEKGNILSAVHERCHILHTEYRENGTLLQVELDGADRERWKAYLVE